MNIQPCNFLLQVASLLYFIGMVGYLHFLFRQKEGFQKTAFVLIAAAVVLHLTAIVLHTVLFHYFPIQNLSQSLSIAAAALGCVFVVFQYRYNLKILGVFASTLLTILMALVWLVPDAPVQKNEVLKGFWFYAHIILVFTGDAALALACGTGILYLLQEKGIKTKKPGFFFRRLPPLDLLDNMGYAFLSNGFALLTVGLVTGFIYAKFVWGRFWNWDPKEVFAVGAWLVYAAMLHLRLNSGWQGRKFAIMTIIGFCIIVFTFLGVNLLLGGHHQGFTR